MVNLFDTMTAAALLSIVTEGACGTWTTSRCHRTAGRMIGSATGIDGREVEVRLGIGSVIGMCTAIDGIDKIENGKGSGNTASGRGGITRRILIVGELIVNTSNGRFVV
jgi:hypothetical protein